MGITAAIAGAAAIGAGASIYGGMEAKKAGDKQAKLAQAESAAAAAESLRQGERQAVLEGREIEQTVDRQKLAFLASGVTLEGSPLLVMEETRRLGAENIEEIKKSAEAGSSAQLARGKAVAQQAKASGRQALISGIAGAANTGLTTYAGLK